MTISQLYAHFHIPPNLSRHMFETAAVGDACLERWTGSAIDQDLLRLTLLCHDLGNIVKFRRPFIGELENDSEYWMQLQDDYQKKYSSSASDATLQMVEEIGAPTTVRQCVWEMTEIQNNQLMPKDARWESVLAELADLCVVPSGIVGVKERVVDLEQRYPAVTKNLRENVLQITQHVQPHLSQSIGAIQDWNIVVRPQIYECLELK